MSAEPKHPGGQMAFIPEHFSDLRYDGNIFFKRGERDKIYSSGSISIADDVKAFQEDIQRVIYSSCFRRLQNKTQVHPLPNSDYFRNRLTHSLEVSEIGQLIAGAVARYFDKNSLLPENITTSDIKDIVATACLTHDLGNPPFGHNGEEAIQSWFERNADLKIVETIFRDSNIKYDFLHFDGNAQTFRIVNRLQNWRNSGGLRLTLATTAASVKYPWKSSESLARIGKKKFGFHTPDEFLFDKIFSQLNLKSKQGKYIKHPLAYIVEAADDIAYLTTDIEDGVKSKSIKFDTGRELLFNCTSSFHRRKLEIIEKQGNESDTISYLRSAAISTMSDYAFLAYIDDGNTSKINNGSISGGLLDNSALKKDIKSIRDECKKNLYTKTEKLQQEAGGHNIIEFMLDLYMGMANEFFLKDKCIDKMSKKYRNIYYLLPPEIRSNEFRDEDEASLTYKMVDYISGMTDTYIYSLYTKFSGHNMRTY